MMQLGQSGNQLPPLAEIPFQRRRHAEKTRQAARLFHPRGGRDALIGAAPSYPVRMAIRIMLRTGLRVSECLSPRPDDIRLRQDPPIISLRPEVTGNKSKRGREVPIPADLASFLADLVSMRPRDRQLPLFDISRQWVSKSMKEAAVEAGIDPARVHPHALRHTHGRNAVLSGVPTPVLQRWLGHGTTGP